VRDGDRLCLHSGDLDRLLDHAADVADVLPGRELGDNAAPLLVDLDL
jgi:hypothetical protein